MTVHTLLAFTVVAALFTMTPGMDSAMVLRTAAVRDRRTAALTATGILTGVQLWGTAASFGLAGLLTASQTAYTALRWVGGAYLIWLGGRMLWQLRDPAAGLAADHGGAPPPRAWAAFTQGLLTNLLNPKVGVFYLAFLPQFLTPGVSPWWGVALTGIQNVESVFWFALLIIGADRARRWLARVRVRRGIDGLTGTVLIGFGIRIAAAP